MQPASTCVAAAPVFPGCPHPLPSADYSWASRQTGTDFDRGNTLVVGRLTHAARYAEGSVIAVSVITESRSSRPAAGHLADIPWPQKQYCFCGHARAGTTWPACDRTDCHEGRPREDFDFIAKRASEIRMARYHELGVSPPAGPAQPQPPTQQAAPAPKCCDGASSPWPGNLLPRPMIGTAPFLLRESSVRRASLPKLA